MKILFVVTGLNTGGAEMMLYKLLLRINRDIFEPVVVSLREEGTFGKKILALNIPLYCLQINKINIVNKLIKLRLILEQVQPDLIQGWMYHGNFFAEIIKLIKFNKIDTIWNIRHSLYSLKYERKNTAIVIKLLSYLSQSPQAIIYNSRISCHQHQQLGYNDFNSLVIPNGFDTELFKPRESAKLKLCRELNLATNTFLIGLIARFHLMKDHANFVQSAKIIYQKYKNINFILVGREVDKNNKYMINLLEKFNLKNRVYLLGERQDIAQITSALDIVCNCSAWGEGFPNVLGEAMACGVPCVVTDIGDSAWIVGETGKVVPPKNSEALAQAWQELFELNQQERLSLGKKARQRIIENFSLNSIVSQYENLYLSISKQK